MTPIEKATALTLAADNLERSFHSALHTLRALGAPGAEALRIHEATIRAASAAADDVSDALRDLTREVREQYVSAGTLYGKPVTPCDCGKGEWCPETGAAFDGSRS